MFKRFCLIALVTLSLNAKEIDPVKTLHGLSAVGASSAISVVVASGVLGVAVLATPSIMNSIKNSNHNYDEKLEVSDESVTSFNIKKENK